MVESEYRKYKEKYYKYKSKFSKLANQINSGRLNIQSNEVIMHKKLDNLALLLKGSCDFSFQHSRDISSQFNSQEKGVLADLLSQSNSNSYSNLIKKLCVSIYSAKKDLDFSFSDASEEN